MTKYPVSALRDLVPMVIMVSSAPIRARQNVGISNVIFIQVTASVVLIVLLVKNANTHVLPTANRALTRLYAMHVKLNFMETNAIETVHSAAAAVGARSRVERVQNIFAKKIITVQNIRKSAISIARDLAPFLTDDVLQSALQEGTVHIATGNAQIIAWRVSTQGDARAAVSDIMETRVRWSVRTVEAMDHVTYPQPSVRMDAFLVGKNQHAIQVGIDVFVQNDFYDNRRRQYIVHVCQISNPYPNFYKKLTNRYYYEE